jgi:hypothetical protein
VEQSPSPYPSALSDPSPSCQSRSLPTGN